MKTLIAVGAVLFALTGVVYLAAPSQHSVIILLPSEHAQHEYYYHLHTLPFAVQREKRICGLVYDQTNSHHHAQHNYHAAFNVLSCNLYDKRQVHIAYAIADTPDADAHSADTAIHRQLALLRNSLAVNFPLIDLQLVANLQ